MQPWLLLVLHFHFHEQDFDAAWHEKALQSSLMTMMRPEWKK